MVAVSEALIVGTGEAPYTLHPPAGETTERYLLDAAQRALADAELEFGDVDGFGLASFTLAPDVAIDIAWKLGLRLRWITQDTTGGCCGVNMLQHALRAVEAGDARTVLLVAGDRILNREFIQIVDNYNKATRDHLAVLPADGPNTLFSFLTQRYMAKHGLGREDLGQIAVAQRAWAALNPGAVYRAPLTIEDYLDAPPVAPPLGRYDCPRVISGAHAIVVTSSPAPSQRGCRVRAIRSSMNADDQEGDGLRTGLAEVADELWQAAETRPEEVDVISLYDDYPVTVLIVAHDLGLAEDPRTFLAAIREGMPVNTSGGLLSAGQAGAGASLLGLCEVVGQLNGACGERQVDGAAIGLVSGYGMVLYGHGACANAAVLERVP